MGVELAAASGSRRRRWRLDRPQHHPARPARPDGRRAAARWRAGNIRAAGHVAVVELELSAPPAFDGVDDPAMLAGRIVVARGIDELERAFDASKYGGASERPQIEAVITLAGGGAGHRLHALVQWVPAGIEPGRRRRPAGR